MNRPPPLTDRPNLIWVFGDQHRGQTLSCAGDPNVRTPHIDLLALDGFRSTAAVAGAPVCCPFRGSLLTSRYPHEAVPCLDDPLPADMPTVAHAFKDAGYQTAWIGKWHLDGFKPEPGEHRAHHIVPPEQRGGFDTWIGYQNNNAQYDCWVHGHDAQGREQEKYRLPGYETDALTDLMIDYVRDQGQRGTDAPPFFASLSVQPPHTPYIAPPEWMQRHSSADVKWRPNVPDVAWVRETASQELAGYHAMVENLDWNLGRLRTALEEAGLADDTIIVFFSDHGDMHGSHGLFRKSSPWEESIRIPFVVGGAPRSRIRHTIEPVLVNHVDIAPTSLGLCGIEPPEWMRGYDYSGCYRRDRQRDEAAEPDSAYLQHCGPQRPWRGVVTRDGWKYACLEYQPWLMFDLNTDPYEQVNLVHNGKLRHKRSELHDRLRQWMEETGDSFNLSAGNLSAG